MAFVENIKTAIRENNFLSSVFPVLNSCFRLVQRLNFILNSMSEKTATVFRMSKIQEISVKKISEQLDISEKAVEYHITKSQKILKEKFKDFYSAN